MYMLCNLTQRVLKICFYYVHFPLHHTTTFQRTSLPFFKHLLKLMTASPYLPICPMSFMLLCFLGNSCVQFTDKDFFFFFVKSVYQSHMNLQMKSIIYDLTNVYKETMTLINSEHCCRSSSKLTEIPQAASKKTVNAIKRQSLLYVWES